MFESVKTTISKSIDNSNTIPLIPLEYAKWRLWDSLNPEPLRPMGVWIFNGGQGSGKTSSVMEYLGHAKQFFPEIDLIIGSVGKCAFADFQIMDPDDVINAPGDSIMFCDEASILFPARAWQKMSLDFLLPLCQSRKKAKQVIFTSQRFGMVDKTIRDMASQIIQCECRAERLVTQRFYDTEDFNWLYDNRKTQEERDEYVQNVRSFVLSNKIRQSYDSFEIISGFKLKKWGPSLTEFLKSRESIESG